MIVQAAAGDTLHALQDGGYEDCRTLDTFGDYGASEVVRDLRQSIPANGLAACLASRDSRKTTVPKIGLPDGSVTRTSAAGEGAPAYPAGRTRPAAFYFTSSTGTVAAPTAACATEPSSEAVIPTPRVPITIMSTFRSTASLAINSAGVPTCECA